MDSVVVVVGAVVITVAVFVYMAIAPELQKGRQSKAPSLGFRSNAILRDDIQGFEGTVENLERLSDTSAKLTINKGHFIPDILIVKYNSWDIEPMNIFQCMCSKEPPIFIRKKESVHGGDKSGTRDAAFALAREGIRDHARQFDKAVETATKLAAATKQPAKPDNQ